MTKVETHGHKWYPFSWDEAGKPRLWACGTARSCIKTMGLTRKGRSPYTYEEPQPQMEVPK
jgi:hypothetical protein